MPAQGRNLYDASYRKRRDDLVRWAVSNPVKARCWQCEQPLATCGPNRNGKHRNGQPAKWTAGHTRDGDPTAPLQLECSPCNYRRGAEHGNRQRGERKGGGRVDPAPTPPTRRDPARPPVSDSETGPVSETTVKPSPKRTRKPAGATKKAAGSPRGKTSTNSPPPPPQTGTGSEAPTGPVTTSAADLVETTMAAVERALASVTSTPRRAVQIATVRRLAFALDGAEPSDMPKISRELDARMAALMADANPIGEVPDWTETTGAEGTTTP